MLKLWDFDFSTIKGHLENIKCQQTWAIKNFVDQEPN